MNPRTPRFEFDTKLRDDVSRPFNLSRGIYVVEYAVLAGERHYSSRLTALTLSLGHPRTGHELHKLELSFSDVTPGETLLGRQSLRIGGGPYFLATHLAYSAHAWIRILRI